jgi:hypothetical protein
MVRPGRSTKQSVKGRNILVEEMETKMGQMPSVSHRVLKTEERFW